MWTSRVVGLLSNLPTCITEGMDREDSMISPAGVVLCLALTLTAWRCNFTRILPGHHGASSPIPTGEHAVLPVVVVSCDGGLRETTATLCFLDTVSSHLHFPTTHLLSFPFFFQQYLPNIPIRIENQTNFIAPSCYRLPSRPWPPLSRPAICGPVSWPPPAT